MNPAQQRKPFEVGEMAFDMHGKYTPTMTIDGWPIEVEQHIRIPVHDTHEWYGKMIAAAFNYHEGEDKHTFVLTSNKIAYIVGEDYGDAYTAMYAYDGKRLGVITFRLKETN